MLVQVKGVAEPKWIGADRGFVAQGIRQMNAYSTHAMSTTDELRSAPSHSVRLRGRARYRRRISSLAVIALCAVLVSGLTLGHGYAMMESNAGSGTGMEGRTHVLQDHEVDEIDRTPAAEQGWHRAKGSKQILWGAIRNRLGRGARTVSSYRWVVAKQGDTVWSLARQGVGPQKDPRWLVDEIIRLNEMGRRPLMAGQMVKIPILR